jgi:hypothetical protein
MSEKCLDEKEMHRIVAALFLFGISFGYLEAAVVTYLRDIYEPIRRQIHPERPKGELFPLITSRQLQDSGATNNRRLLIELGREASTLIMLASIGLAITRRPHQWVAASLIAFGVWDISFYAFLRLMIDWPQSLLTWDILFLLPVPWVGPVLAPVLVSLSMIGCGLAALSRPISLRAMHWLAIIAGGLVVVVAFCWDFRNTSAGGLPNPFNWPLFAAGELMGLAGFAAAAGRPALDRRATAVPPPGR